MNEIVQESSLETPAAQLELSGATRVFMIVGDPVAQVKSPGLVTRRLVQRGIDALVIPAHVSAERFDDFMAGLACMQNLDGLIATVPHKQAMLGYCARTTDRARYAGSVNVMRRTQAGWVGDNTDGQGYIDGILKAGGSVQSKRVLLIGAGGAGSAIAYEFLARGASSLAIHDVDTERRDALIARLEPAFPGQVSVGSADPRGFDIVANATPLGMRESDPFPVEMERMTHDQFAACPITQPAESPFIVAAKSKGCMTMPGLGMFKAQEELLVEALLTL